MTIIVADTCSLVNFAAVNRMDIVEATLRRRARWTQAVEYEVRCLTNTNFCGRCAKPNGRCVCRPIIEASVRAALGWVPASPAAGQASAG